MGWVTNESYREHQHNSAIIRFFFALQCIGWLRERQDTKSSAPQIGARKILSTRGFVLLTPSGPSRGDAPAVAPTQPAVRELKAPS
jgi:hypothetical protein